MQVQLFFLRIFQKFRANSLKKHLQKATFAAFLQMRIKGVDLRSSLGSILNRFRQPILKMGSKKKKSQFPTASCSFWQNPPQTYAFLHRQKYYHVPSPNTSTAMLACFFSPIVNRIYYSFLFTFICNRKRFFLMLLHKQTN